MIEMLAAMFHQGIIERIVYRVNATRSTKTTLRCQAMQTSERGPKLSLSSTTIKYSPTSKTPALPTSDTLKYCQDKGCLGIGVTFWKFQIGKAIMGSLQAIKMQT